MAHPKVVAVVGPNASGKSHYAVELAGLFNGEIISADSRQVYRSLDLGTGKITPEEMRGIPHHLMDIIDPGEGYSLFDFQRDAYSAIHAIHAHKRLPIIVGGTGLYLDAVLEGYRLLDVKPDPMARSKLEALSMDELMDIIRREQPSALHSIENRNKRRLIRAIEIVRAGFDYRDTRQKSKRLDTLIIGIGWERDTLRERIRARLHSRLEKGMIEEVEALRARGVPDGFLFDIGLEYRAILRYLQGGYDSRQHFIESLEIAIGQFAKRQMTWFRKRPGITWIDGGNVISPGTADTIRSFMGREEIAVSSSQANS
uniref:tRNA dimethylallyltransferase n=1 Tax=Candidatus Kentrum eta TaxID=2126337 RepID=A0A450VFA1_9GAMM|nr:MAG: tRNA dimethylallyltransferase [Candidatus Kentron sp. H]VFJ98532.1 MAG: tRNA dimethylallyltransferase [Candidatus Kentron sp. H]VFK03499.1 MAG: tRNA dimethylallyltransferase [Candidatus Kentron sp. H]